MLKEGSREKDCLVKQESEFIFLLLGEAKGETFAESSIYKALECEVMWLWLFLSW